MTLSFGDSMLVTYVKCDADGSITRVGFWPGENGWWMPSVRKFLVGGGSGGWTGGIQVSDPYHQPERWLERAGL